MTQFHAKFILRLNINITKNSHIEDLDSLKYNCQSLDSTCDKICVGNGRFFYFNNDGKLDLCCILKRRYPVIKQNSSVISIERTEMNWKTSDVNGLYIPIFLNKME